MQFSHLATCWQDKNNRDLVVENKLVDSQEEEQPEQDLHAAEVVFQTLDIRATD